MNSRNNKTRTSEVGAISKAQKGENILSKKPHSAKKSKRGTLLDFLTDNPLQNMENLEGGPLGDIKKFSKKSHTVPKNIQRGPLGTSGFVGFLEKVKNERGTLLTKFAFAGLSLRWFGGFRIVSKKWTYQCKDCSLKKRKVTAIVGHFSFKG